MSAMPGGLFVARSHLRLRRCRAGAAAAQSPAPGLTLNRDLPLRIESISLECAHKQRMASFIGKW